MPLFLSIIIGNNTLTPTHLKTKTEKKHNMIEHKHNLHDSQT